MQFPLLAITALVSMVLAAPTGDSSATEPKWGTGGGPPDGYSKVENFCSGATALQCCETIIAGAGGVDDSTCKGGSYAMVGGQEGDQYGFCPIDKTPVCCTAVLIGNDDGSSLSTGCGIPLQVQPGK